MRGYFPSALRSFLFLLALEAHAVGALIHRGSSFMRADMDAVEGAVFRARAVVRALVNSAVNGGVAVILVHEKDLLLRFPG